MSLDARLRGHRPDPPGVPRHAGAHMDAVLFGTAAPPASVDLRQGVIDGPGIGHQRTNSCTGWQVRGIVESQFAHVGTPIGSKSPIAPYDFGRCLEIRAAFPDLPAAELPALGDFGAIPFYVVSGVAKHGLAPFADRLDDPATINERPGTLEIVHADEFRLAGWSKVEGSYGEKVLQLQLAIAAGHYPAIAIQVDQAFEDYMGGLYQPGGAKLGGHAVYLAGFDTRETGEVVFWLVNHWGTDFGIGGFALMPEKCVADWTDIYVLNPVRVA